jgi:phosphate transport system protein
MSEKTMDSEQARGELGELERQVIALGNLVENLFAESVMLIIERREPEGMSLRAEDCRAHERVIEIDHLCLELLARGELNDHQVRFIWSVGRIATDLKRTADESLRIGQGASRANLRDVPDVLDLDALAQMVALVQSMLGDCIEAFINRDTEEATGLHSAFRELRDLAEQSRAGSKSLLEKDLLDTDTAFELANLTQRLLTTGQQISDIGNLVAHLHQSDQQEAKA